MNCTVVDFQITEYHLARDRIHVNSTFHHLIIDSISSHFNDLVSRLSTSTTSSNTPLPSSTATSNEIVIQSQSSRRSREANDRRNKKRQEKLKNKQQQLMIKRKIHSQWTLSDVKQYLRSIDIDYGRILPIFNQTVRIQFNNQRNKDHAENTLGLDAFNEDRYQAAINSQKP